jgi:hypothetical protein
MRLVEVRNVYNIFAGKTEWKRLFGIPKCGWRIILKWILLKLGFGVWNGLIWFRI